MMLDSLKGIVIKTFKGLEYLLNSLCRDDNEFFPQQLQFFHRNKQKNCPDRLSKNTFCWLLILYWLSFVQGIVDARSAPTNFNSPKNTFIVNAPASPVACQCPHEEFLSVRAKPNSRKSSYNIGDKIVFECDFSAVAKPEDLIVYPSALRTCQPNCTWSGVPPVCLDISKQIPYNHLQLTTAIKCLTGDCFERTKDWESVGTALGTGNWLTPVELANTKAYVYVFPRHVYLSHMTVKITDERGSQLDNFNVYVKVKPTDVIHSDSFSEKANIYLSKTPKKISISAQEERYAHTVVNIEARVREIYVKFSAEAEGKLNMSVKFYGVSERDRYAVKNDKCPAPPSIANSVLIQSAGDGTGLKYVCNPGYQLVDPLNDAPFTGKITCHNGFEWTPYPYPVCKFTNSNELKIDSPVPSLLNNTVAPESLSNTEKPSSHYPTHPDIRPYKDDEYAIILGIAVASLAVLGCCGTAVIVYVSLKHWRFNRSFIKLAQIEPVYDYPKYEW